MVGLEHYLTVAAALFVLGIFGIFLNRKSVIVILLALLVTGAAAPRIALACSPTIFTPSPVPVQGPACALSVDVNDQQIASLGAATRLSQGMFLQVLDEGSGCHYVQHLVVHDCARDQVMIIGAERWALMQMLEDESDEAESGLDRIRDAALAARDAGRPLDMDGFVALSHAHGYGAPQVLRTNQSLRFGRQTMPLSCACRRRPGQTG